jgi:transcription termination factor NusA
MTAELLMQHGFKSAEDLAESDADTIAEVEGVGAERARTILQAAKQHVEEKRTREAAEAEEKRTREAAEAEEKRTREAAESTAPEEVGELEPPETSSDEEEVET